jgi:hypothetical protein
MISLRKIFQFYPCVSVGPFHFGNPITCYKSIGIKMKEKDLLDVKGFDSATFGIPEYWEDFDIITINGLVCHILVEKQLYYNNNNIIGKKITDAKTILSRKKCSKIDHIDCTNEDVYYFNSLGIDLWTQKGIVVSATCYDNRNKEDC